MYEAKIDRWKRAAELLDEILDLPPDQQKAAAEKLGKSRGVLNELQRLLAGLKQESILDGSLDDALQSMPKPAPEHNAFKGEIIGNWKLGNEIGRGGMSVVYHAERTGQEFEQHAALKILWVAYLGEAFVESFLRERQILSDLHHPGIAQLIDGGITPDGSPYLVMQYVDGERIDQWCRNHSADLRTIVRLLIRLCQAVAYAQRHLIVHQDIKPGNVLVDEHGQPVLIDFGIARLLDQAAGERAPRVFTPQFAAPEQRTGDAITTATDVYALGALSRHLLKDQRIGRDLDLILQVAMRKDPEQRYANARNLAEDLQAWLEKRPVQARPATLAYRAGRFVARNRWGVAATAVVLMSLIGGLAASMWQARIAAHERDIAQAQSARATQVTEFLKDLFRASDPDRSRGEEISARELLDLGAHQVRHTIQGSPGLKAEMLVLLGDLYRELGEFDAAEPLLEEGLDLAESNGELTLRVEARRGLALLRMETGAHDKALNLAEEAEDLLGEAGRIPGALHATLVRPILFSLTESGRAGEALDRGKSMLAGIRDNAQLPPEARLNYLSSIGTVMMVAEQEGDASAVLHEAAEIAAKHGAAPSFRMHLYSELASLYVDNGDLERALAYDRRALGIAEEIYPPVHPQLARRLSNIATILDDLSRYEEAQQALNASLAIYEEYHSAGAHPRVAAAHNNLGRLLEQTGRYEAARPHMVRAWELAGELFGTNDPRYVIATGNLGNLERELGHFDRAQELLLENLRLRREILGPDHRAVGGGLTLLASLRLDQNLPGDALQLCDEALDLFERVEPGNPNYVLAARTRRARALAALGRDEEAMAAFDAALRFSDAQETNSGEVWLELLASHATFLLERAAPGAKSSATTALQAHREALGVEHPDTVRLQAFVDETNELE